VGDTDIYFVSNQRARVETVDATFRVSGKAPELWHPDTGKIEKAPVWTEKQGRVTVPLRFEPAGSVFVVFRKSAAGAGVSASPHFVAVSYAGAQSPNASAPKLEIRRAIYEAIDGAGSADVTERVKAMVKDGTLSLNANNQTLGGDPTPLHLKRLRVEYLLDGKPHTVIVNENEDLEIPPAPGKSSEFPVYELTLTADGKAELKTIGSISREVYRMPLMDPPPTLPSTAALGLLDHPWVRRWLQRADRWVAAHLERSAPLTPLGASVA
jgi:hypothetical protein